MPSRKKHAFSGLVYLLRGKFDGRATWHYLLVDRLKVPLLREASGRSGEVDISSYGKILFCGWGEQPPETVAAYIAANYALDS